MDKDDDGMPLNVIIQKEIKIINIQRKIKEQGKKYSTARNPYKNHKTSKFTKNDLGNANRVHVNSTRLQLFPILTAKIQCSSNKGQNTLNGENLDLSTILEKDNISSLDQ